MVLRSPTPAKDPSCRKARRWCYQLLEPRRADPFYLSFTIHPNLGIRWQAIGHRRACVRNEFNSQALASVKAGPNKRQLVTLMPPHILTYFVLPIAIAF